MWSRGHRTGMQHDRIDESMRCQINTGRPRPIIGSYRWLIAAYQGAASVM